MFGATAVEPKIVEYSYSKENLPEIDMVLDLIESKFFNLSIDDVKEIVNKVIITDQDKEKVSQLSRLNMGDGWYRSLCYNYMLHSTGMEIKKVIESKGSCTFTVETE